MNPPIREARHQSALWQGILDGTVDVLGSDHAPHSREEKARPYPESPSGMPGVQTLLPLMLEAVSEGRLSMARLIDLTSAGPARIYGMRGKGRIARGMDADFTVVDLKRVGELRHADMASRCGWTPFDGWKVRGWPVGTLLRGVVVMWEGELQGRPQGRPLRFEGCAEAHAAG
jgi:dihydroorotase